AMNSPPCPQSCAKAGDGFGSDSHPVMVVGCPVCPKADTAGRFMSTRPSLTPLAGLGRSAGQAPLHRLHTPGIAAGGDDAEIAACLLQHPDIEVSLGGCLLNVAHLP